VAEVRLSLKSLEEASAFRLSNSEKPRKLWRKEASRRTEEPH
jgi:hypothetical protein